MWGIQEGCIWGGWPIACVEFTTAVSRRTPDRLLSEVTGDFKMMHMSATQVRRLVRKEYVLQLTHQMGTCGVNLGLYMCTNEVGLFFAFFCAAIRNNYGFFRTALYTSAVTLCNRRTLRPRTSPPLPTRKMKLFSSLSSLSGMR